MRHTWIGLVLALGMIGSSVHAQSERQGSSVALQVDAAREDLTLYLRTPSGYVSGFVPGGFMHDPRSAGGPYRPQGTLYERVCKAPCTARLAEGRYEFGIGRGGGHVVRTGERLRIDGPTQLELTYRRRPSREARIVGWTLAVSHVLAGAAVLAWGAVDDGSDSLRVGGLVGGAVAGVGLGIGIPMTFAHEWEVDVTATPR
jgi:hypothetical protein